MSLKIRQISLCLELLAALLAASIFPTAATAAVPSIRDSACAEIYTVQADDWLSKIADKLLGDLLAYPAIISATNQKHAADASFAEVTNPDLIEVGWKLCIPAGTQAEELLTEATKPAPTPPALDTLAVYTLDDFVNDFKFTPYVKPEWIYTSPERLTPFAVRPEHAARAEQYGYRANYLWNKYLSDGYFLNSGIFRAVPPEVYSYDPSWRTAYPRYRYPANVTLPTGLTTNPFGWRGPALSLKKPARTIRIACVGASTTVDGHSLPFSYPELLQHWLNLWAQESGYNVRFEVINAGREGIGSRDIAAVARYEVLPLDVDYVVYYEGSNQFDPRTMVSYPADVTFGQPPAGVAPNFANVDSNDKTWLDQLSEYSALAARARSLVEQFSITGSEPAKPEQTFFLPDGLNEFKPDRAHLGKALALKAILADLNKIKHDLEAQNVKFVLATFDWFVYDGLVLDPARHRVLYGYLNRIYWPISYANMRRMADLQNRVFRLWAAENRVSLIDVAGQMPKHPDLYDDAIHNTELGIRIRAWINFQTLVPLLKRDIEIKRLPRPARLFYEEHPYLQSGYEIRALPVNQTVQ
ncbi:MAG: hypothetical protein BroJett011_27090 [Chloroflexota bacterium]|nr:MAG: hypothetical protein BroJett011_27090 [Chloroflexota bacterium]